MPLWEHIERTTFPGFQGTPYLNHIAAKAVFFKEVLSEEYKARQFRIIENAKRLGSNFVKMGYDVLTGGTDNHMVLINVANFRKGLTGITAQRCLEDCGIVVNMNKLPYDKQVASITSGIRLGTPIVTKRGMGLAEMDRTAELIDTVLRNVRTAGEGEYEIEGGCADAAREGVETLCRKFTML
jgi:glycine hydroxymethyltransferase